MVKEDLVKRIKWICQEKGISVSQLESRLEFSPGLISRWVRMSPSIDKIIAVADELGVSLDELAGRTGDYQSNNEIVEALCRETSNGRLLWQPCGYGKPLKYPITYLKELYDLNGECGYCEYENGYFVLACNFDEEGQSEMLGLYVFPDAESAPIDLEIDREELIILYDLIADKIKWESDREQASKMCSRFLRESRR